MLFWPLVVIIFVLCWLSMAFSQLSNSMRGSNVAGILVALAVLIAVSAWIVSGW